MGILRFSVTNHNAALILSGAHVTPVQFKRLMTLFGDGESLFDVILTEREAIEKVTGKEKYEIIRLFLQKKQIVLTMRHYNCAIIVRTSKLEMFYFQEQVQLEKQLSLRKSRETGI